MPSTAYDAKGLMIAAILDNDPVVFIDDRWLYRVSSVVPEKIYSVPIGKGIIRRKGADITIVSVSYMMIEAQKAVDDLVKQNIDAELIDLRTIKPFDKKMVLNSVKKTGRLVVVDGGWKTGGFAAEVLATVCEEIPQYLKAQAIRITLPDVPAPSAASLESCYYPKAETIVSKVKLICKSNMNKMEPENEIQSTFC